MSWNDLLLRLRALIFRRRVERALDEELQFHIEMQTRKNLAAGMSAREARRRARAHFGGFEQVKEECRDARGLFWIDTILQDVRYALRVLRKSPSFTVVALVIIGIGIGANTTVFSLVDAMFFRPLPLDEPYKIINIYGTTGGRLDVMDFSYPAYKYFRDHSRTLSGLAAHYSTSPLNVVVNSDSREVQGAVVSANYFSLLRVSPLVGRFFLPEEDAQPGRSPVAVVGFYLWQQWLGGQPDVIGKALDINGTIFKIVGVAPRDFGGVLQGNRNEIWIPAMMAAVGYRGCRAPDNDCGIFDLTGRIAPGWTLEHVRAEMSTLFAQWAINLPHEDEQRAVRVLPARGVRPDFEFASQARLLMAVGGALLLIACANLAGLLLARGTARTKEIAVRLSLGAGRWRVVRQLLTESLLLAVAGGILGMVFSVWGKELLLVFYASDDEGYRHYYDLSLNIRTFGYSLALSMLTGCLFGLIPAIQSTRQDLAATMKDEGAGGSSRSRLRSVLVAGQVMVSMVLLVGAGLLVRSAGRVAQGANFDPRHVALLRLRPGMMGYGVEKAQPFLRKVVQRLETMPGVEAVSFAKGQGLVWLGDTEFVSRAGDDTPNFSCKEIGPRYFETLRIPLIGGREFNARDQAGSSMVAIVNETLVKSIWPAGHALGRTLRIYGMPREVVGIVKDAMLHTDIEKSSVSCYVPFWQVANMIDARMCVRVKGDPYIALPMLHREIARIDPNVPITEQMSMMDQIRGVYMHVFLARGVVTCAGAVAILLSAVGLYGVLAYTIGRRRREFGIRMALGACARDVRRLVLRQGMVLASAGTGLGLVVAVAFTRLIAGFLYGVAPWDPAAFATGALMIATVAFLACLLPAMQATQVDPAAALRHE